MSMTTAEQPKDVPCGLDPAVIVLMRKVLPCECGNRRLLPVSDLKDPAPTIAVACDVCGEIEGNAPTLAMAVANWNSLRLRNFKT